MDVELSETQQLWREAVRQFVRRECPPTYARRCDREGRPPAEAFRALASRGGWARVARRPPAGPGAISSIWPSCWRNWAAAFDDALGYAKQRRQFGWPIGKFQAVAHKLADMQVMLDVSRTLVYRFAGRLNAGKTDRRDAVVLKLYTGEAYKAIADHGMQILGGYGYIMDWDMQRHFRDSRLATIGGGSSEIQRNIIAQALGL